jgi:transposase-like protein
MSDREIKGHLEEIYNIEVSADLISRVTNICVNLGRTEETHLGQPFAF